MCFTPGACLISHKKNENIIRTIIRKENGYIADFNSTNEDYVTCIFSKVKVDEGWLWHKKLSHLNLKSINNLLRNFLVRGLPNVEYTKDGLCDACLKGKQRKSSLKSKTWQSTNEHLQ